MRAKIRSTLAVVVVLVSLVASTIAQLAQTPTKPAPAPTRWRGLIGEYGPDDDILIILEKDGRLGVFFKRTKETETLTEVDRNKFKFPVPGPHGEQHLIFERDRTGRATQVAVDAVVLKRRNIEPESGNQLRIEPVRPVAELMKEALAAQPLQETGDFLQTDLVEVQKLDPTIRLEIRYATTNNFLGTKFYTQARAFMQRPAAEALVRAHRNLKRQGYGLLIHDAYRPWYVTKVFWDATPEDKKWFVADPSKGSRHNRGCAVDLTLYHLKTGKPVEMVATYDETTDRAHSDYPGGTSLQRWHRELLRRAMEAEGFAIYAPEWWHFDYKDWQKYRIGNVRFEQIQSNKVQQYRSNWSLHFNGSKAFLDTLTNLSIESGRGMIVALPIPEQHATRFKSLSNEGSFRNEQANEGFLINVNSWHCRGRVGSDDAERQCNRDSARHGGRARRQRNEGKATAQGRRGKAGG